MKKVDAGTAFQVTEAMLQTGAYSDLDDLLGEISRDLDRYDPASLIAVLVQSKPEKGRFSNRPALLKAVSERFLSEFGRERATLLLDPVK